MTGKEAAPQVGDQVSWKWGPSHPTGTVAETRTEGQIAVDTPRGSSVAKKADPANPAVRIERSGNDVVKRASELTVDQKAADVYSSENGSGVAGAKGRRGDPESREGRESRESRGGREGDPELTEEELEGDGEHEEDEFGEGFSEEDGDDDDDDDDDDNADGVQLLGAEGVPVKAGDTAVPAPVSAPARGESDDLDADGEEVEGGAGVGSGKAEKREDPRVAGDPGVDADTSQGTKRKAASLSENKIKEAGQDVDAPAEKKSKHQSIS